MSEMDDLERRLHGLAFVPNEADWNDVLHRAGRPVPAARFTRRRLALAIAAVVVVGSLAGGALWLSAPQHGVTLGTRGANGGNETHGGGPIGHVGAPAGDWGIPLTIEQLRSRAPYIPLPNSQLANDGNVKSVRFDTQDAVAEVDYSSGITLTWEEEVYLGNPTVDSAGPVIDGVPSLVPKHGPSLLWLQVLPNTALSLRGPGSEDDLIDAAKTLSLDALSPDGALPPDPADDPGSNANGVYSQHVLENWAAGPMLNPVPAASVDDAASSLAFQPVAPSALGEPSAILHTDPAAAPSADRVLSLRYDDPSMGRYWLLERPSHSDTSSLLRAAAFDCKSIPQSSGAPCDAYASMVDVDGTQVLVINGWGGANLKLVAWVENGVYFEVVGLPPFGGAGYAVSVAKTVVAAAAG